MPTTYVYKDPFLRAGWTDDDTRRHFHLDGTRGYGGPLARPSIVRQVRQGVAAFEVSDLRVGGARLRVASKRTANRICKLIDDDRYNS